MIVFLRGGSCGFEGAPPPSSLRETLTTPPGKHSTKRNSLGLITEGECAQAQNNVCVNNGCRLLNMLEPFKDSIYKASMVAGESPLLLRALASRL